MQLAAAPLRLLREDADLGHEIVVDLALDLERRLDVDLAGVRAQVGDLASAIEPLRGLRLGQRDPDRAPEPAARLLGEERHAAPRDRISTRTARRRTRNPWTQVALRLTGSLRLVTVQHANEGTAVRC